MRKDERRPCILIMTLLSVQLDDCAFIMWERQLIDCYHDSDSVNHGALCMPAVIAVIIFTHLSKHYRVYDIE